jgi:predicted AlkP superfamily pyrophosphatase or phosphodiesterase
MPRYRGRCLTSVLPAAVERLGIELPDEDGSGWDAHGSDRRGPETGRLSDRPRGIVLMLVDGLGLANLVARSGHAPFLVSRPRSKLLAGFPTTTVASLGSLGTGLSPGRTALAGYSLRDPATGKRANLIQWDTPTAPRAWQPHPTIFERLDWIGRPAGFVGEARFADSAMTQSSLRGARFYPSDKAAAAIAQTAIEAARGADGLLYVYWGALDKIGHGDGWQSQKWADALEALDAAVRRLSAELPRRWEIWLTADHGMVDVTDAPTWDLATDPELDEGVTVAAGEPRALHLYTADVEGVASRWRHRLGANAWILTKAEAVAAGLFGEVDQRVEPYLGDLIVAMAGRATVLDARTATGSPMVGHHGSLTAAEVEVPLLRWAPD